MRTEAEEDHGATQILAHGMLTSVSVANAALKLLARNDLAAEDRRRFGDAAAFQLEVLTEILREIARGRSAEALVLLGNRLPRPTAAE